MLNSMTGFGRGRAEGAIGALTVELRSVNHRFLDIAMRAPGELSMLEPVARTEMQQRFKRGRISVYIGFEAIPGTGEEYRVNEPLLDLLEKTCRDRHQEPVLSQLFVIPGIVISQVDESREELLEQMFKDALKGASDSLSAERSREGEVLQKALLDFHDQMKDALKAVEAARGEVVQKYRERLQARLEELLGPQKASLDEGRLEQEVMFFADKADIAEETLRLGAHLDRLEALLKDEKPDAAGRQLDFLSQEMLREVNTIGSKCRDLEIAGRVLDMKNLLESMKEQIANIE